MFPNYFILINTNKIRFQTKEVNQIKIPKKSQKSSSKPVIWTGVGKILSLNLHLQSGHCSNSPTQLGHPIFLAQPTQNINWNLTSVHIMHLKQSSTFLRVNSEGEEGWEMGGVVWIPNGSGG